MTDLGASRELVGRINADAVRVLQLNDVKPRLMEMGADVVGSTPQQFGAFLAAESAKWAKVIKEANIRAE